jgi:hypothetical protein
MSRGGNSGIGGRHDGWNDFSLGDLDRLVTVGAPLLLGLTVSTGTVISKHLGVRHCLNVLVVSIMMG